MHCEVYPVNSLRVEPIRPGPYVFHAEDEATTFVEESPRALEYLGCTVFRGAALVLASRLGEGVKMPAWEKLFD